MSWWERAPVVGSGPSTGQWWENAPVVGPAPGGPALSAGPQHYEIDEQRAAELDLPTPSTVTPQVRNTGSVAESDDDWLLNAIGYGGQTLGVTASGANRGLSMLAGTPVELINAAPMLANLLPGVDGVGPISDRPVGGMADMYDLVTAGGAVPEIEPQDPFQSVMYRVGMEGGMSAVPTAGLAARGAALGREGARRVGPVQRTFVEPAAVDMPRFVRNEVGGTVAAGTGAGVANEMVGAPQHGENFWSDFLGALFGVGAYGVGSHVVGGARNVGAAVTGNPQYMDDVAQETVANRIMDHSTTLHERARRFGDDNIDTTELVEALSRPAPIEDAVPGYQPSIADRAPQDPGLAAFVYNQDAASPGASIARRTSNETAIDERMAGAAPEGEAPLFREAVQEGADTRIADATRAAGAAQHDFDMVSASLAPAMTGEGRGADIRAALVQASTAAREIVRQAWAPLNRSSAEVDIVPLAGEFDDIARGVSTAERDTSLPGSASVPQRLVREGADETGSLPEISPQRLNEVTGLRSVLTDAQSEAARAGRQQEAHLIGEHIDAIDTFMAEQLPADLMAQYDVARAARRDFGERFERPQTGIGQVLGRDREQYQVPDSAVARRFVQSDEGRIDNFEALMREAGNDDRVRGAVRDQVLADVRDRGLLDDPEALGRYLDQYGTIFRQFPDLHDELGNAASLRRALDDARGVETETTRRLTTPGRSATASYLRYGDERTTEAVRSVLNAPRPWEAARELIEMAGGGPDALANARAALWQEVMRRGRESAPGATGNQRWSGRRLRDFFEDPRVRAVADELWADDPEDLANIRDLFARLSTADGSTRARAPNTSGTAQALRGQYDPSISTTSLAARARSVHRGFMSPTIAIVDAASMWVRNRSAQVQAKAIDTLTSAVVNNPGLAAELLRRYNPADYAARRRRISQIMGVRATQLLNLLDEIHEDQDPVLDAVMDGAGGPQVNVSEASAMADDDPLLEALR